MLPDDKVQGFIALVEASRHIAVCTHIRPDGDALGSSGAMYHWLKSRGKHPVVVLPDPAPATIAFIHEGVESVNFREDPESARGAILGADLLVCTDFNTPSRAGELETFIRESKATKVLFDHHLNPELESFLTVFSTTETSSCCEVIYHTLQDFPIEASRCLMAGMTTDTNNFANSVYPSTLRMASELMAAGVDRDRTVDLLFFRYRRNRVEAIARILDTGLKIRRNGIASIVVSRKVWHDFGLQEGELEGMVNIPLSIDEVKIVVYLREDPEKDFFHVSVRSKKGWSANAVAKDHFHGGGHENASGGRLYWPQDIQSPSEALSYLDKLNPISSK